MDLIYKTADLLRSLKEGATLRATKLEGSVRYTFRWEDDEYYPRMIMMRNYQVYYFYEEEEIAHALYYAFFDKNNEEFVRC